VFLLAKKAISADDLFFGLKPTMTEEQETYVDAIMSDKYDIIFCNAPAGTGKTTLAVAAAKLLVCQKKKEELLYVFNPVEEDKMGFRPGDQFEKEKDYTTPLRDALVKINENPGQVIVSNPYSSDPKLKTGTTWVKAMTHVFARGTNQENKIIIIDEAQNWTTGQLKKMLTRIHDNCKTIVIGHTGQIDLRNKEDSGFEKYIYHFKDQERAKVCHLTKNFRGWIAQHADTLPE
jgi:phosphate starvation-inducible protein PhoH